MCVRYGCPEVWRILSEHAKWIAPAALVFLAYVVAFGISEFAAQWRIAIMKTTGLR